ncbi:MAG: TRAP transporter large permease subunit [Myxococcales bacterium]|nr:TRAP transporter large permease subunit [Myxococcales bacterium]
MIAVLLMLAAIIGTPLFSLFGGAALSLFMEMPGGSIASPAIDVLSAKFAEDPNLMSVPLFTFSGYLLAEAGTPRRLVGLSQAWLGWVPGSLAGVCLVTSAFVTTFTGGSGITIVAVGALLFPALMSERYPERFALGLVTTGGSLGLLFPPSVPLIMYAIVAGLVMEKVLVAGILPGLVVVLALWLYSGYVGVRRDVARSPFQLQRALAALWVAKWEVAIPIVMVGGLGAGLLRMHEACAFCAVYVLFIEVVVYRDIHVRRDLPRIVIESMTLVGAILIIMATAIGFTGWMVYAQIPMQLLEWVEQIIDSQVMFLLALNLFLLAVGMLMDIFTAIVVVVPLVLPIAEAYSVDPYHLAIVFLLNLEIGYLTPPVGINLFYSSIRFGKPITTLYRAVLPFIGILFVALMIVTYIPSITTFVPELLAIHDDNHDAADDSAATTDGSLPDDLSEDLGLSPEELMELGLEPDALTP